MLRDYLVSHINDRIESNKTKSLTDDIGKDIIELCNNEDTEVSTQLLNEIINASNVKKRYTARTQIDFNILKKMMYWQYRYYQLGRGDDKVLLDTYALLWDEHIELYNAFTEGIGEVNISEEEFTFKIDYSMSLSENLIALDKFADATRITLNIIYKALEGVISGTGEVGIMPFWLFHKDVIGNEPEWYKTINYWLKYYYAYIIYDAVGRSKSELVRKLIKIKAFDNLSLTENDMSNSIHKVDKYINEADRLIASAKRGTFPI